MPVFSGSTSTSATSTAYTSPATIKSFSLVNKSGGAITVSASILYGSTNVSIMESSKSLAAGEAYRVDLTNIVLLPNYLIYVLVSGATDYYFTIQDEGKNASTSD